MSQRLGHLRRIVVAAIAGVSLSLLPAALPVKSHWQFTVIDVPIVGETLVYGLNNQGIATGYYYDNNNGAHSFLWSGGKLTPIDYPGSGPLGSNLHQINQNRQVAGDYYDESGVTHPAVYNIHTKTWQTLPKIPGATANGAGGINDDGILSGCYTGDPAQRSNYDAWLFNGEGYEDSVDPASDQSKLGIFVFSINNNADFVGYYVDTKGVNPDFLKAPGVPYVPINVEGADYTQTYGINNRGVICGNYEKDDVLHGSLLVKGKVTTIDFPGAMNTWIAAVNDKNPIGGSFEDQNGLYHGFVARYID